MLLLVKFLQLVIHKLKAKGSEVLESSVCGGNIKGRVQL